MKDLMTKLFQAIRDRDANTAVQLVARGALSFAPADLRDTYTSFMYAVNNNQVNLVRAMLAHGARADYVWPGGSTTFHYAVSAEMAELLFANGAQPDSFNAQKQTPLYLAASRDFPPLVEWLCTHGCRVNVQGGDSGRSPLHYSACRKDSQTTQCLLNHGASPNLLDADKRTPLFEAVMFCAADNVRLLLLAKAEVNLKDTCDYTPLMLSADRGDTESMILLLQHGASPLGRSLETREGFSALDYARQSGNETAVSLIQQALSGKFFSLPER